MTTINRTKLLEYLDHVMDEELKLSRLMHCCLSDSILERETETRLALAYRFKEFEAEKAKSRMQATQFKEVDDAAYPLVGKPQIEEFTKDYATQSRGTLGEIAKMAAIGHTTAEQYDAIQRKGTEEQKTEVASGNSSIKKVYTQIQKAERLVFGNEIEEKEELKKVS
jgi:hypothetical protein